jgi:hypothetical protein
VVSRRWSSDPDLPGEGVGRFARHRERWHDEEGAAAHPFCDIHRYLVAQGRLTFRVPRVPAGRYAAVAWCLPCGGTLIGSVPWSVPDGVEMRADGSLLTIRK